MTGLEQGPYGINRIRLEFKGPISSSALLHFSVLIESDWNLKYNPGFSLQIPLSINRIRLEFKVATLVWAVILKLCINRIRLEFKV